MSGLLEPLPDYDTIKDVLVWRCISARYKYGHWEYLYDDPVLETHLQKYLSEVSSRGAQRISLHLQGAFKDVYNGSWKEPMHGAKSIAQERKFRGGLDRYAESH